MAVHSTSPTTLRVEMHVGLEFMPGTRSYFSQVMPGGEELSGTGRTRHFMEVLGLVFGSYVYRKHNIILSKADSNLHIEERNTRQGRDLGGHKPQKPAIGHPRGSSREGHTTSLAEDPHSDSRRFS